MSYLEQKIQERLKSQESQPKKQVIISLETDKICQLDSIVRTLSTQSGRSTSRNMIIEDAIDAYIHNAMQIFESKGIEVETEDADEETYDTVIVPGRVDGFRETFLDENCWYYVRIKKERIPNLKYIAIYVGAPLSKITHYGKIAPDGFEYDDTEEKYIVYLDGEAIELENPIPLGEASPASTRAPRYTTLQKLLVAEQYKDL